MFMPMSTISRVVVAICLAAFTVQFSNPVFVKQLAAAEIGFTHKSIAVFTGQFDTNDIAILS